MDDAPEPSPTRRRALMLGATGAASVLSIRPALAQAAGSVMLCEIPVPDAGRRGGFIAKDGAVVPAGTQGAFAPPGRPLKGEDVRRAIATGGTLPGVFIGTFIRVRYLPEPTHFKIFAAIVLLYIGGRLIRDLRAEKSSGIDASPLVEPLPKVQIVNSLRI